MSLNCLIACTQRVAFAALTALALLSAPARASIDAARERTLSPYFVVERAEAGVDALPLKSTAVEVRIAGVIADVKVRQRYRNEGERPLEARYVFPASTRAAVNALTMKIGDRVVQAEIREKQAARRDYEGAKREGKSASLLEQQRPNVFQMSIANLMPGDDIEVELRYSEADRPRPTASIASSTRPWSGRVTTVRPGARAIRPSRGSRSRRCARVCRRRQRSHGAGARCADAGAVADIAFAPSHDRRRRLGPRARRAGCGGRACGPRCRARLPARGSRNRVGRAGARRAGREFFRRDGRATGTHARGSDRAARVCLHPRCLRLDARLSDRDREDAFARPGRQPAPDGHVQHHPVRWRALAAGAALAAGDAREHRGRAALHRRPARQRIDRTAGRAAGRARPSFRAGSCPQLRRHHRRLRLDREGSNGPGASATSATPTCSRSASVRRSIAS